MIKTILAFILGSLLTLGYAIPFIYYIGLSEIAYGDKVEVIRGFYKG